MAKRNPNRGVVLSLADAYALHRWLEFQMDGRKFFNPIVAMEAKQAAEHAKGVLFGKLAAIAEAHHDREDEVHV